LIYLKILISSNLNDDLFAWYDYIVMQSGSYIKSPYLEFMILVLLALSAGLYLIYRAYNFDAYYTRETMSQKSAFD